MALGFSDICALLDDLEKIEKKDVPLLRQVHQQVTRKVIHNWFKKHRATLDAPSSNGAAILSTLFPERRTDRVYGLREARLCNIFARCMLLSARDARRLQDYRVPGKGDLGECIERVQRVHDEGFRGNRHISVNEIDYLLEQLAATCRFSSPDVRSRFNNVPFERLLASSLTSMKANEKKWLVRLILKDFTPVILEYDYILQSFHFLLPSLLRFQDCFESASRMLEGPLRFFPPSPDVISQTLFKKQAALKIKPQVGIKVGQPTFHKARSAEHCLKLANRKRWSIERKYDGEYCEVHVDLRNVAQPIKLFSKSGKDSTTDRSKLLVTLSECLQLGTAGCAISRQCILLGEMVVFSDRLQDILPFHAIRKHVSRSGSFLGANVDSPQHADEHLMIIFFDLILLDDDTTLVKPHVERRQTLHRVVKKIPGRAMTSEWKLIDFSQTGSTQTLLHNFAASIVQRHEGLVLKPADAPYFSLLDDEPGSWHSGFIKLKKDYMEALGDSRDIADLLVVGAGYDAREAQRSNLKNAQATKFYVACLSNADAVRFERMPVLQVVGCITSHHCVGAAELQTLNNIVQFHSRPFQGDEDGLADPKAFQISLPPDCGKFDVILDTPVVVEVLGSGFVKPPNCNYYMLRHPRILKLHLDRGWQDATSFADLQDMAETAKNAPSEGESQEMIDLLERLQRKMQSKADRGSLRSSLTPRSPATTRDTLSPRSPLAPRRDNGNASLTTSLLGKQSTGLCAQATSPQNKPSPSCVDTAMPLPTPPTPSAPQRAAVPAKSKAGSPVPHIMSQKRPSAADHVSVKRLKVDRHLGEHDTHAAPRTHVDASTRTPKCVLGEECRWASANAIFYLAPTVKSYSILLKKPGLIPIHGGTVLENNSLSAWSGVQANDPDGDVVQDSQGEALRLLVLVEPLRPDECHAVEKEVEALAPREVEFWDWRVMELQSCLDWTTIIATDDCVDEDFANEPHCAFLWKPCGGKAMEA